ncbi:MAG: Trm112 family protein [Rhodobacteraceae bacterium]|nr:Trm112 family protein [Paracoccaceae bacterium]
MKPETRVGFDRRMLEVMVCPQTHSPLRYDAQRQELVSTAAGLAFPIRDGIPIMVVDAAREIEKA